MNNHLVRTVSALAVVAVLVLLTAPADAQRAGWRHRACAAYTAHANHRDWTWLHRHGSRQAVRALRTLRSYERARIYRVDAMGTNKVECEYYDGPDVDVVRRHSGFLYATGAWWED